MRKKIYVISSAAGVIKIGVSCDPESRLKQLQIANNEDLSLEYQTAFCDNADEIEKICHVTLSRDHVNGEWFSCDKNYAISTLKETFSTVSINMNKDMDEYAALGENDIEEFYSCFSDMPTLYGMYKISHVMPAVNEFRVKMGLGKKQLASFFINEATKRAIANSCLIRRVPVQSVKMSSRGKFGGTYVDDLLLDEFVKWCIGSNMIGAENIKDIIKNDITR